MSGALRRDGPMGISAQRPRVRCGFESLSSVTILEVSAEVALGFFPS